MTKSCLTAAAITTAALLLTTSTPSVVDAFAPARPAVLSARGTMPASPLFMAGEEEEKGNGLLTRTRGFLGRFRQGSDEEQTAVEEAPAVVESTPAPQEQLMNPEADMETKDDNDTASLLEKVKAAGKAGVISYALWELAFWFISIPVAVLGYVQFSGHWPDFSNSDDVAGVGAEAFAFVNFARFAVPLRIGLALSSVGWVQENIVDQFFPEEESKEE